MCHMDELEDKLFELQKVCNRYNSIDCKSHWPLFALTRYIRTNRATRNFEKMFMEYPVENFEYLIKQCLNGDCSDDGIIQTCKRIFLEVEVRNLKKLLDNYMEVW